MTAAEQKNAVVGPNAEVMDMVRAGVRETVVIGFIKRHDGAFDVSAGVLAALKAAGVSEKVIAAMTERAKLAGETPPPATPVAAAAISAAELDLPNGAVVRLQFMEPLASNVAKLNDAVRLQAVADVMVDGRIVIARGALASGRVTQVTRQLLTRAGRIEVTAESVQAIDGTEVKLRGSVSASGGRGLVRGDEATLTQSADLRGLVNGPVKIALTSAKASRVPAVSSLMSASSSAPEQAGPTPVAAPTSGQDSIPTRVDDGRASVFHTRLPVADATAKVKAWYDGKNVDYTVNPDTGRITSDWFGERRCGPGFHRCANKAAVRIVDEGGQTVITVQVFERKREAGMNTKPWNESSTSKGKETTDVAMQLQMALAR